MFCIPHTRILFNLFTHFRIKLLLYSNKKFNYFELKSQDTNTTTEFKRIDSNIYRNSSIYHNEYN